MAELNDDAGKALTVDDTIELLNEEEPKEVIDLEKPKKEEEKKEEESEAEAETDELKELEEEIKEPTDEDLELTTPARRRDILKEFPDLFKKFPYLEKAYYREQQFTEVFPTIPDAKLAAEKASTFDNLESKVMTEGDLGVILQTVKEESQESFNRVVDNFLPSLMKTDQGAYYHVLGNVVKSTIMSMLQESQNLGENGEPLKAAANILNQFVFGTQNFSRPETLSKPVDATAKSREDAEKARVSELLNQQFESARDDLQTRTDNVLKATIEGNIDPKSTMSDYVKKNAVRDAFDSVEELIKQDSRFKSLIDKLWEDAYNKKFNKESVDRIKSAYLSKAKTLLPTVIKKARGEALKGMGKKESESPARKGPITPGRSTSQSGGKLEVPKGMKSVDFLMQD